MNRLEAFEDYFVSLYKKFGIARLDYDRELLLDDKDIHKMVFSSDDFNRDHNRLQSHCKKVYKLLKRRYHITVRKDFGDNYYVTVD